MRWSRCLSFGGDGIIRTGPPPNIRMSPFPLPASFRMAFESVLIALLVPFVAAAPVVRAAGAPEPKPAPAWTLKDVDGETVSSEAFAGKVVILGFWATWCSPCLGEIAGFKALHQKFAGRGLAIVAVSMDEEGAEVVKPFMKKTGINYRVVLGDAAIAKAYGNVRSLPTAFIIDREGRIVATRSGFTDEATFEKAISPLL